MDLVTYLFYLFISIEHLFNYHFGSFDLPLNIFSEHEIEHKSHNLPISLAFIYKNNFGGGGTVIMWLPPITF